MPIEGTPTNPVYTPNTLTDFKSAQKQVFGKYSNHDMSGFTSAAYNYMMQEQKNAYDLELWKLTNQYNDPAAQMSRFSNAGLNPNLIYGQQQTASVPQSNMSAPAKATNFKAQNASNVLGAIGGALKNAVGVLQGMRDIYSFAKYGETYLENQNTMMQNQAAASEAESSAQQAKANAMAWYYGNGVPFGSPYALNVGNQRMLDSWNIRNAFANYWNTKANTAYTMTAQIPYTLQNTLYNIAMTKNAGAEYNKILAQTGNIFADTAVKKYMLQNMYPLQAGNLLNTYNLGKLNYQWQNRSFNQFQAQTPWLDIDVGNKTWNNILRYGVSGLANFYGNLPIWNPQSSLSVLGKLAF